jgi:hypothetical protein
MIDVASRAISLFDDLIAQGEQIKDACKKMYFAGAKKAIDVQAFEAWRTSCLTLLRSTFGTSSPHFDSFVNLKFFDHYNSTLLYLGIMQGAREDVRKGYFYHKDLMLSVNIFSAFLARARAYAEGNEAQRGAGLLEAVLCEALRKLAEAKALTFDPTAGIAGIADGLRRAGAIRDEVCNELARLEECLRAQRPEGSDGAVFAQWLPWTQKFIYEHLGSKIVIEN